MPLQYVHDVVSIQPEYLWIVIVGGIFCFCAAWGIGANDTANSWGSTVGAKAISVRNAAILAGTFEVLGAFTLGGTVGGTLKNKIVDPKLYCDDNYGLVLRMLGMLSVDLGTAIWLFIASRFGMPVSTTHAAVGGICGFGIITRGWPSIIWWETMGMIFISWVTSPLLSSLIGFVLQYTVRRFMFQATPGKIFRRNHLITPLIGGLFVGVAAVFAFYIGGKSNETVKALPSWMFGVTFAAVAPGMMIILSIVAYVLRKRWNIDLDAYVGASQERDAEACQVGDAEEPQPSPSIAGSKRYSVSAVHPVQHDPDAKSVVAPVPSAATFFSGEMMETEVDIYEGSSPEVIASEQLWNPICWVVASTESFSHGANDVGNAIGPYAALIDSYNAACPKGTKNIPYWILGLGAVGILLGLVTYGHRVVKTLGTGIGRMSPQRAAVAEMATVMSVLIATALAIPVSTTHCAVGGITGVSLAEGWRQINWRTIAGVAICIVLTVPACALMTAAVFGFIHAAVFGPAYPGPMNLM